MTEAAQATESAEEGHPSHKALPSLFWPVACVVACLVMLPVFTVLYVAWTTDQNNHKFCATLGAITAQQPPGPAAGNPSRAYDLNLYSSVMNLEWRLGCP